ncbi:ApaG domain [Pelagicoccus sp. SDUM812005]|uniref:Co(2+)/Mg(2+) efflux protein ApaG n=1 Tax=Pelagicoccus sp. SDUM812005 TaxID=3041257 RepID=UPI002810104A|nr:ApaG domain [Pelagicoccus sp. SDUM812005]MDQ8179419.1 ApaG domain [Pelagicoccus sp. SDUM812005]
MQSSPSEELDGLVVRLDDLRYQYGGPNVPPETPHVFIYFITIENNSDRTVTLLGRKWIIHDELGETLVVEGDKIVGEEPELVPGEHFSYNSFHIGSCNATARGSFHGQDEYGHKIHCLIPPFDLTIPDAT